MPPDAGPRLLAVLGSVTPPGRLYRAIAEATARASERGVRAGMLDLAERGVAFADGRPLAELGDGTARVVETVIGADAVVFATPIYRGSMTGALKNLFDLLPVESLAGKVVGTVSMGASDHHFLGADRHLRDVLAFFGAFAMPVGVYLTGADFEDGTLVPTAALRLDELFEGVIATATDLDPTSRGRGPAPLAAASVPRA